MEPAISQESETVGYDSQIEPASECPVGRPSRRRNIARACIDYVLARASDQRLARGWLGERLFDQRVPQGCDMQSERKVNTKALTFNGMTPKEVQACLHLCEHSLRRFRTWLERQVLSSFTVVYFAEGGSSDERRQGILNLIQEANSDISAEPLVICGHVDPSSYKRLRPFEPILLHDIAEDSGFSLEELTYLVCHEGKTLDVVGQDDLTYLFSFLRAENIDVCGHDSWTPVPTISASERNDRFALARQCLQAGAGNRVESLLADRKLGAEADMYLALGHLQSSELEAARYYYERLKNSGFLLPPNIESLIQSGLGQRQLEPRRSFALNELDLKLRPYLGEEPGIFIEAGGNDGVSQSNTLYFERYHQWRGILVEGIPDLAAKCLTNRPRAWVENCALVPFDFDEPHVSMTYCNLMSVVDGAMKTPEEEAAHIATGEKVQQLQRYQVDVRTKTLSSVIESYGAPKIDLLSLDVEGFELQVLQGLDLERHGPTWMLIEARYRDEIDSFVSSHYDVVDELSHHDVLYRRRGV